MKFQGVLAASTLLLSLASGRPSELISHLARREVPQEHSHEQFLTTVRALLNKNNPNKIADPVFGLLGDAVSTSCLWPV